jgi:hypothetical protein
MAGENELDQDELLDAEDAEETVVEAPKRKPGKHLLDAAVQLGYNADDLANYPAEAVEALVAKETGLLIAAARQPRPQAEQPKPADKPKSRSRAAAEKLKAEAYDDALVKTFEELADESDSRAETLEKQISELRAEILQTRETSARNTQQELYNQIDRAIVGLNRGDIFGEGSIADHTGTDFQNRRIAVAQAAMAMPSGSIEERIRRATRAIFRAKPRAAGAEAEQPAEPKKPKTKTETEKWNEAALAKPTRRNSAAEPQGDSKAMKTAAAKFKEFGIKFD